MFGASANVTAEIPVTSSGSEVAVDSRIKPTHDAETQDFSAMMSP